MRSLFQLFLIASYFLSLGGCSKHAQYQDLQQFIAQTQQIPAQPINPLPKFQTVQKFSYSAANLRDPFQKVVKHSANGIQPDKDRPKEPLENYPLDGLKMVGVLVENNKIWGIVIAPDSSVFRVKAGNYIGQNYGRITAITPAEITILEIIPEGDGWTQRKASLVLK